MELVVVLREQDVTGRHRDAGRRERVRSLRLRAEETRTVAEQMHHASTQATMLRIARAYERTADLLEGLPDLPSDNVRSAS